MRRAPGSLITTAAAALTVAAALGVLPAGASDGPSPVPVTQSAPASVAGAAATPAPVPTSGPVAAPTPAPRPVVGTPRPVPRPAAARGGAPVDNTQVLYDTFGQRLDAHDGDLLQAPDGTIFLYGTAYGCGFDLRAPSPYCGVRVYTTPDLRTFTPAGAVGGQYAFNHLGDDWQSICSPPARYGCYRPQVIRRPADGRYVMWVNVHHDTGYRVLVADHPAGPFVDTGVVPDLAVEPPVGGLRYGDMDLTVDTTDGSVYVTYTAIWPAGNAHELVVEKLDASATTGTGTHTVLDAMPGKVDVVEAPALFRAPTGTWHVIYSDPARPYRTTGTGIMNAPSPMGPWTAPRTLSPQSCSGQPTGVWPIVGPGRSTTWVWGTDRWENGKGNQAKSNNYYGQLTFTAHRGTAIDAARCQPGWRLS